MKKIFLTLVLGSTMALQAQIPSVPGQSKDYARIISVSGEGTVKVVPDHATLRVRVENEGKSANDVKKLNDVLIDKVLKFCKEMNIENKDIKTEYLSLNKNYDYQTKEYKYVANQTLSIRLKDLSKYEALSQGLLDAGINRIDGVSFDASDMEELKSKARIKAVENAKKKAEEYAAALGKKVGDPIFLSETGQSDPVPMPRIAMMKMEADAAGGSESIAVGEMSIKATVNVGFELK